jgi:hypothetical protein
VRFGEDDDMKFMFTLNVPPFIVEPNSWIQMYPMNPGMHITGHKNPGSLNKYRTLNENRKKEISQILSTTTDDTGVS